jgi:murein L,D-transpeptidase YafK
MPINYPNADDKEAGRTGSDVGLHGAGWNPVIGLVHWFEFNWTAACIAVSNSEIEQIRSLLKESVPLEIKP